MSAGIVIGVINDSDSACLTLLDSVERDLAGVSKALERLDAGSYGSCEVCAAPLDAARLADSPLTGRCDACPQPVA
jgi:DnaK suppressor protein